MRAKLVVLISVVFALVGCDNDPAYVRYLKKEFAKHNNMDGHYVGKNKNGVHICVKTWGYEDCKKTYKEMKKNQKENGFDDFK